VLGFIVTVKIAKLDWVEGCTFFSPMVPFFLQPSISIHMVYLGCHVAWMNEKINITLMKQPLMIMVILGYPR
jgi:hypothetical protein